MAHFHDLVEEASTISSSTTGVDYKNDYFHKKDDAMPQIFAFETQEFARSPSNAIAISGADDK